MSAAVDLDERQRRIAQNEALFRKVNERIQDVQEALSAFTGALEIVCECGKIECSALLSVTTDDYENLRSEATWFAVTPGHEIVAVERIVASRDGYEIVEKRPGPAADEAEATDPRS